jgi:2-aminobenzoate-CoA ligase
VSAASPVPHETTPSSGSHGTGFAGPKAAPPGGGRAQRGGGGSTSAQVDRFVHDLLPPREQWPDLRYDLPELQMPAHVNLVQALFDRVEAAGHAQRPLLRSDERTLSYAQARAEVDRIANVLTGELHLVPGNRVLLRGGNSIAMALAWLGVVQAGLIAVATMPLLRARELSAILTKARPSAALCDAKLQDELRTAWQADGACAALPMVVFNADEPLDGSLETRARSQPDATAPCRTAASDVALLAFTSGTTGSPKAAVHTHGDVLAACETWPRHILRATSDDIVVGSPPLAFTFGLGGLLVFPMWAGASVYFPSIPYTPEAMVTLMNRVGATICYTAPTFYRQMAPFAKQHGVGRLRISVSAGEGLPDATRQLWKEASGIEMLDGIGATEMFHIFISSPPEAVRRGAIGQVVPGYQAKIVDEEGHTLPPGEVGRLAVKGPTGCRYLDDPRQSAYVQNGWNFPGDAFSQDADGYFFYQARTDDMIITAGYNVAGPEVEAALLAHPVVAECGVVGRPDDERGMVIVAYVVLKPGETGDAAQVKALQDHVKHTLAPYKYPRDVIFTDKLPRTETGKLQRFALRQQAAQATA